MTRLASAGTSPTTSPDAAIRCTYDEVAPLVDAFRDGQLHMWFFYGDEDDADLATAVARISHRVTDTLNLRAGEHLLDAGSGPGGSAVGIARAHDVRVTGIAASQVEVDIAIRRAEAAGLAERVCFARGDYAALPHADGAFDAVLALESLMHARDLDVVLGELRRVLRPGGRLALSDFTVEPGADPDRIAAFVEAVRITNLLGLPEWLAAVRRAGFVVDEYTQCGPRVLGMRARYLEAATALRSGVVADFGEDAVADYSRSLRGFFVPRRGEIGYTVIGAHVPR